MTEETTEEWTPDMVQVLEDNLGGIKLVMGVFEDELEKVLEAHRNVCISQVFYGQEYSTKEEYDQAVAGFLEAMETSLEHEGVVKSMLLPPNAPLKIVSPHKPWERPGWPRPPAGFPIPKDAVRFRNEAPGPGYC